MLVWLLWESDEELLQPIWFVNCYYLMVNKLQPYVCTNFFLWAYFDHLFNMIYWFDFNNFLQLIVARGVYHFFWNVCIKLNVTYFSNPGPFPNGSEVEIIFLPHVNNNITWETICTIIYETYSFIRTFFLHIFLLHVFSINTIIKRTLNNIEIRVVTRISNFSNIFWNIKASNMEYMQSIY